ncbi:DEAD/DEAH box helicase [Streptomyces sp. TRM43335]|uniref:DEAD/DEAH box helicase n=1 Tax=Streptomyces taklimakanensis TaxID=2569853 RepID=A0A6G2BKE9_9ACTN|nr:DEAD/DEAH box helicase [Streptomyces taklimakanensis]
MRLRPHQAEAVDAIVHVLEYRAGRQVPAEGLRATAVAATGAGKTLIAAEAARRLEPRGRVLVMVPTLDLLTQTIQAWQAAGHTSPAVAVCSLEGNEALEAQEALTFKIPRRRHLPTDTHAKEAQARRTNTPANLGPPRIRHRDVQRPVPDPQRVNYEQ